MTEKLRSMVSELKERYDPENDIGVGNMSVYDMRLLTIITELIGVIEAQAVRLDDLENPSEYHALMLHEMATSRYSS
jgi:hypothetical protein